ncbi:hypothetical protein Tco_1062190 [Tanacetum coccineum]
MITEEMKHMEHYRMYAEVFGLDVPLTQSQPTESTQGTYRTPSAPRSPTHKKDTAKSSAPKRSTVIRFLSLAEHKSQEEQEARENVELVNKHLASEEIENMVEGLENIPSQVDASVRSYMSGHILHVHPTQTQTLSILEQQYQLYLSMKDNPQLQQQDIAIWLALQMKFENLQVPQTTCRPSAVRPRDQDDPHDDAHPEGENSAKRQKTSEYEAYVFGELSSRQIFQEEQASSTSGNQEQDDDFDF